MRYTLLAGLLIGLLPAVTFADHRDGGRFDHRDFGRFDHHDFDHHDFGRGRSFFGLSFDFGFPAYRDSYPVYRDNYYATPYYYGPPAVVYDAPAYVAPPVVAYPAPSYYYYAPPVRYDVGVRYYYGR
jgi:hypothetical protein